MDSFNADNAVFPMSTAFSRTNLCIKLPGSSGCWVELPASPLILQDLMQKYLMHGFPYMYRKQLVWRFTAFLIGTVNDTSALKFFDARSKEKNILEG